MPLRLRVPTDADWPAMARADGRAFGLEWTDEQLAERRPTLDLDRFRVIDDGGALVGIAGSYELRVTMPGGGDLPVAGVTWVSVAPTHRRQGLLHRLMAAVQADIVDRGEPLALLTASDAGIYGRFGYGCASEMRTISIDRRRVRRHPDGPFGAAVGVRYLETVDEVLGHVSSVWPSHRRQRPGELDRTEAWHRMVLAARSRPLGGAGPAQYLAHRDGYLAYRITEQWPGSHAEHQAEVVEVVALTPDAHRALWSTMLEMDLVGTITSARVPLDDPLPFLLADPRVVTTTGLYDHLWARPVDLRACLAGRTYGVDGRIVVEVATGQGPASRFALEGGPEGASVARVRSRADLTTDLAGIGALLLGGVRPSTLAAGRRLEARREDLLRRADAMFCTAPLPACQTPF